MVESTGPVALCLSWLSLYARHRVTVNKSVHSYLLKHEVERAYPGNYIHQDSFKAAALAAGYGDEARGYKMAVRWRNSWRSAGPGETFLIPFEVTPAGEK